MGWTLQSTGMWRSEVFSISDCLVFGMLQQTASSWYYLNYWCCVISNVIGPVGRIRIRRGWGISRGGGGISRGAIRNSPQIDVELIPQRYKKFNMFGPLDSIIYSFSFHPSVYIIVKIRFSPFFHLTYQHYNTWRFCGSMSSAIICMPHHWFLHQSIPTIYWWFQLRGFDIQILRA